MVHIIWCWLDNHTNWNCHNLMKVPVWNTRNTNLSELCLRTVANVNKILKERKKEIPLVFLKVGLCSYLHCPTLKLQLLAVFGPLPRVWPPAGSVHAAVSWCPKGHVRINQTPRAGHHVWRIISTRKTDCDVLQVFPLTEGHHITKNKKSFHPWWRIIIMEE